jgi:P27 family predicted phage terminase small subunit
MKALMPGPPLEHPQLRLLKGNPGKRPTRSPPQPAVAEECPPPPRYLNDYAKEKWQHIAPELHRLNLLTVLDVSPLAAYCCAAAQLRQAEEGIEQTAKHDPRGHALTVKGSAGDQVRNPLRNFHCVTGSSPSAMANTAAKPAAIAAQALHRFCL